MNLTQEIRWINSRNINPAQEMLYRHYTSGQKLFSIAVNNKIETDSQYDEFVTIVGDIILGFYKIEDTVPLLQQELNLDAKTAALLGADVLDFLAPLSDPTWQPPIDEYNVNTDNSDLTTNEVSLVIPSAPQAFAQIQEPRHYESTIIPEIRTMAADMAQERSPARNSFNAAAEIDEPVYVSNQPTLEKKVINVPSYSAPHSQPPKPDTDSRWN